MDKEKVEKKTKATPWALIVITIVLIIIPIIFKIISTQNFNESSNLPKEAYTDQTGGAALTYFFIGFAMHALAMWLIIINLVIVSIIWIIYFIKRKKKLLE